MAEIKNSFLRSKMNKDLDDRLIPNGEYRDAQNISVGKSEADDIGSLETVLGNLIQSPTISPALPKNIKIIGFLTDEYTATIFIFATTYTDPDPNEQPTYATSTERCVIYSWVPNSATAKLIADGAFLNFSTTNKIQSSLIEDLLFFTDNRNQPRKVNINNSSSYYTEESQISVAKYNPYLPINLFKSAKGVVLASPTPTTTTFGVAENLGILQGMSVMSTSSTGTVKVSSSDYVTVTSISTATGVTTVTLSKAITAPTTSDIFTFLISTMTNESSTPNWPGDPDYLEGRYVRFSYRYRFDDGEYSIMAPFTQIAYIPKQKGYFKNGNEDDAFRSTIVEWMENNTNNVELLITLPDIGSNINTSFKIQSLDILFKESDGLAVKVLETVPLNKIQLNSTNNIFSYNYQSRKPYKTLPQAQTTRVFDKVPVRSLSQETAGNRVIYGNFRDIYTAPDFLEYDVKVINKGDKTSTSWIEYPNHNLKQNRNYQVGFILADKYGRQSSVILSPVSTSVSNDFLGSTLFLPYNTSANQGTIKDWFGKTLQLSVTAPVISGSNSYPNFNNGEPGLYAIPTNSNGFAVKQTPVTSITNTQYQFTLDSVTYASNVSVPVEGDYLRGEYVDFVKVNGAVTNDGATPPRYTVPTEGRVNSSYANNTFNSTTADKKFAYKINQTGWYSYKVVVKQTEQDYYNVYIPGILDGYPASAAAATPFPTGEDGKTANIVLINDNINKVPRDLSEVGPEQKQFRSSVQLYGRVENNSATTNIQFFPGISTDTAISIATSEDSNMSYGDLSTSTNPPAAPGGQDNLYQIDTKPLIARVSTSQPIGSLTNAMRPFLAIYETEPVDSLLDIFWETGTVGLVADLNADIATGYDGPVAFTTTNFSLLESDASGHAITDYFYPVSNEGTSFDSAYPTTATMSVTSIRDGSGADSFFILEQDTDAASGTFKAYRIKTNSLFTYLEDSITQDIYTFNIIVTVDSGSSLAPGEVQTIPIQGSLSNVIPAFVQSPLPTINVTVDQTGSVGSGFTAFGQDTSAVNGTNSGNTAANKVQELKWTIDSGNPIGANGQPSFDIVESGSNGGNLTQTANNTPSGQHTLVLKIEDANGTVGVGSLSATLNQIIIVGPQPANSGIKSTCLTGPINANIGVPITNALITKIQASAITGVWYLSDNTLTAGDLPTDIQPSTAQSGDASLTNTLFKIGDALTEGTLSISMNAGLIWEGNPPSPSSGLEASVRWKVYHRTNSSASWTAISDINNFTINNLDPAGNPSSGVVKVNLTTSATGQAGNFYDQRILAYNQPGEYAVAAVDALNVTTPNQSNALTCWVNSNDLYYSTCVIENGVNVTGGTAQSYQYSFRYAGSSYCSTSTGSGGTVYSHVPYGQYVTQFYTSSALSTIFNFNDAGGGVTSYVNFITAGSSPYYDNTTGRYNFSTRFNVSDAKVYVPNPWTSCYVQACSNAAGLGCNPNVYYYPQFP